jgi:hypothetical protein
MVFLIFLPSLQVTVVCTAIGSDPKPMWIGVVNKEISYNDSCTKPRPHSLGGGCDVENLSCQFLSKLPNDTIYLVNKPISMPHCAISRVETLK